MVVLSTACFYAVRRYPVQLAMELGRLALAHPQAIQSEKSGCAAPGTFRGVVPVPSASASTLDARALSRNHYARSGAGLFAGYPAFESRFNERIDPGREP